MGRLSLLGIIASILLGIMGCEWLTMGTGCTSVSESIYINTRYPDQVESYSPDSMQVLMFENGFSDTVSVFAGGDRIAKQYLETRSNGLAGMIKVNAQPSQEITLTTQHTCAHFTLKDSYKYLYINKSIDNKWAVAYSNFSRGYL
jgi:hypothetical protein